ncbi:MAG: gamma-glutamylcyclotransferase family protein [Algibacter sp.]
MKIDFKLIEQISSIIALIISLILAFKDSLYFLIAIPIIIILYLIKKDSLLWFNKIPNFKKVKKFTNKKTTKPNMIFVYGSLLNPESLLRTIEETENKTIEYIPSIISGYKLTWINTGIKLNMIDRDWNSFEDKNYGALNIIKSNKINDKVYGAVIQVSNEELKHLENREKNYNYKNVTSDINSKSKINFEQDVYTFISDDSKSNEHFVIREEYYTAIKKSLKALGFKHNQIQAGNHKIVKTFYPDTKLKKELKNNLQAETINTNLIKYLMNNDCVRYYNGDEKPIPSAGLPLILNRQIFHEIIKISEAAISLSKKTLNYISNDESLKKLSGFSDYCFEMATKNHYNTRNLPEITRVDLCLTNNDLNIFEINTDSPGGMFHVDCLVKKQKEFLNELGLNNKIDANLNIFNTQKDLCCTIVDALTECWNDFNKKRNKNEPLKVIAIVEKDWKTWSTKTEFEHFKKLLIGEKYDTDIYEPDELDYIDGHLIVKKTKKKIDLIYKRVLWNDFFDYENKSESEIYNNPFFVAYKNNSVCMVNSLNSWLAGNKLSLALMKDDLFNEKLKKHKIKLTDLEKNIINKNIPETYIWDEKFIQKSKIMNNIDSYIIKSFTGFGSKEFVMGGKDSDIKSSFLKQMNKGYIVQEKLEHGKSLVPIKTKDKTNWLNWSYIIGAYVINGKCVAIEAKFAEKPPITMNYDAKGHPVAYRTAVFPTLN